MLSQSSKIVQDLVLFSIFSLSLASGQDLTLVMPNSSSSLNEIREWTAMGDSYASGIGAGALPQGPDPDHCFRCSNSYPRIMQSGPGSLDPAPQKFNFVACSGATFKEIFGHQLAEQDRPGRPAWGDSPEFVTLTLGGNDVGILPLVLTCIYSIPIQGIGCDAVISKGFGILESRDFGLELFTVINTVRNEGRRKYGRGFHIFVTGYAQLFNGDTDQCDDVTFKPSSVLLPAQHLTKQRRRRMNELAVALNSAIETTVGLFHSRDVIFVDYDHLFEGHRFCDRVEPNPNDDETWFFQLGTTSDPSNGALGSNEVPSANEPGHATSRSLVHRTIPDASSSIQDRSTGMLRPESTKKRRDITAPDPIAVAGNLTTGVGAALSNYWRVFHPKTRGHQAIRRAILEAIDRRQI